MPSRHRQDPDVSGGVTKASRDNHNKYQAVSVYRSSIKHIKTQTRLSVVPVLKYPTLLHINQHMTIKYTGSYKTQNTIQHAVTSVTGNSTGHETKFKLMYYRLTVFKHIDYINVLVPQCQTHKNKTAYQSMSMARGSNWKYMVILQTGCFLFHDIN